MEFLYGQIIALHWRKKTLDSYRQGRLLQQLDGLQTGSEFTYDLAGNRSYIKIRVEYDLLNREIRRIEKDGGITRSFYNGNGHLSKVVRPNQYDPQADDGARYQYTYDHQGRVLTVLSPDGHVLQSNTYDADGSRMPASVIVSTDAFAHQYERFAFGNREEYV